MSELSKVKQVIALIPVSSEMVASADELRAAIAYAQTPEGAAELAARRDEFQAQAIRRRDANVAALAVVDHAAVRAVLDLHSPTAEPSGIDYGCEGCPIDNEYGPEEWPCATVSVVARHYGINLEVAT